VCFTAISLWCILGSIFSSYLNTKKRRLILDIILAILLVLTAISIIIEK
jgi:threonine/homoserine/homoserine lactone efflux protein